MISFANLMDMVLQSGFVSQFQLDEASFVVGTPSDVTLDGNYFSEVYLKLPML